MLFRLLCFVFGIILVTSCSSGKEENKEEHIRIDDKAIAKDTALSNAIKGNLSLSQIPSSPNRVVLTGLQSHRLITVYKPARQTTTVVEEYYESYGRRYQSGGSEHDVHYMPGIDLIHGYNLLNIAHYDLATEKLNFLFDHPVLVKSLYYPSFEQDSIDKKPINRDYYLVSAYDADTNGDTLISKIDLRRFYYFDKTGGERIQLVPQDYSVIRSQYDSGNDIVYVFARHDSNKNGKSEDTEPMHIFWFSLKQPAQAKRMY